MSDQYQYAVFFEANNLTEKDRKRIRTYFQIKRHGGGDCGKVEKIKDNIYRIAFEKKEDQERVLQKREHNVEQGNLVLLLRSDEKEEEKQAPSHAGQQASGGRPVEKCLKLNPYLLRYLKDSSKAKSNLEERLSSLLSTFKLEVDFETVTVIRDAVQTNEDDIVLQKWEAKVEKVFSELQDRYIIHFEVEPLRLQIIQQNQFIFTENFGIYEEEGLVVIVGEINDMERQLKIIDALQHQQHACQECAVSETQYALVKDQFEQEIKCRALGIQIKQERQSCLILNGPKQHVQLGADKLQEFLNKIQEKHIQLQPALGSFLTSSGALQDFQTRFQQNLCSPVVLETTGSELVLLSLSTGALQEAAAAIHRDLCVKTVQLENAESDSSAVNTLKKSVNRALEQANQGSTKVEVSYEPGPPDDPRMKVQLVGYSADVSTVKDIVMDYKQNYAEYSDTVPLPCLEMVNRFFEVLSFISVKFTKNVNVRTMASPSPCAHLSGPCCEVKDLKQKLNSAFSRLICKQMAVDGPGVRQFFEDESNTLDLLQKSCQVVIFPLNNAQGNTAAARNIIWTSPSISSTIFDSSLQEAHTGSFVNLEIAIGGIEQQQADVLVAPMLNTSLTSTKIGNCLFTKAGQRFKTDFDASKRGRNIGPGDVLEVDGTPLGCNKVFFIECEPWSVNTNTCEMTLRCGLKRVLALCEQQSWNSVAIPVIGPGVALSMPIKQATAILTEVIEAFGMTTSTPSLNTIRIVIMPHFEEIFQEASSSLSAIMVDSTGLAVFRSLSSDIEEITIPVGRCQLHIVFGDIIDERTDVIVNTTDFTDFQTDVCNDILKIAGLQVRTALTGVRVNKGDICTTQPGNFLCKKIMHVCGQRDTEVIKKLARDLVTKCESSGYNSVALPAICAGKGGLDPRLVAQAILQGIKDEALHANFLNLRTIRIVLKKIHVFLEFKAMAQQMFGTFTQRRALTPPRSITASARGRSLSSLSLASSIDLHSLVQALPDQQTTAEFEILGWTEDDISKTHQELCQAYERNCSSHVFTQEELKHLALNELDQIINNVSSLGIQISQHGLNGLTVSGLTKGVHQFSKLIQKALLRQVKEKEQGEVFARVSWCILGARGKWERLPVEAHIQLEAGNGDVTDALGQEWTVNLSTMKATEIRTGLWAELKRLENLPDFTLPLYWSNMDPGEVCKVVNLDPNSTDFKRVKDDFKKTVQKVVIKIERIQNVNLRRAYEVRKKELQHKNGSLGAGEKVLYHGTTKDACNSIQNSNFNRRFAGQNGVVYGLGTYFAVQASYSANHIYSVPSADGTQLMFVTLVLTGRYTQGARDMKSPPPRSSQNPHDCFDSVVDNMQNPGMFVVFHDCQAYPDYLITFR